MSRRPFPSHGRVSAALAASLAAAVLAGCAPPPPPPAAAPALPEVPHVTPIADADLRGDSVERAARRVTMRLRTTGCGTLGTGSGFAVDSTTLVTNRHVIGDASQVQVNAWDGTSLDTSAVGIATSNDLAIVEVDQPLPVRARLAAGDPQEGDPLLVVGYPGGGQQQLVRGVAVGYVDAAELDDPFNVGRVLRLRATGVRPGSSGGPVLDADGNVVAVVYAIQSGTDYVLAVPVSALRQVLAGLASGEGVTTPDPAAC